MSLKELKNTLKSCTSSSLLACSATNSSTRLRTEDQTATELEEEEAGGEEEPPPPRTRKPPKSSLRQQLKSLGQLAADLQADHNDYVTDINTRNKGCALSHSESEETFRKKNDLEVPVKRNCNYEGEEDEAGERFRDSEAGVFIQPHTEGPFEPLILGPCPKTGCVLQVPASINCRLLEHQRDGVKFLYNLYRQNHGGVLGDDMGLGKTIQTIAFVAAVLQKDVDDDTSAMLTSDKQTQRRKPILIICPTSVLQNWENEFNEWGTFSIAIYHGVNKELVLEKMKSSVIEIILTSFDTFRIHGESLCGTQWEVVIIDEAHRLKNERSQLYKAFLNLRTKKCYGLTGTIMQNKIMDLFNVFDLISSGCLGTREHFREYYDEPLKQGQRISAPERFVEIAEVRKNHLLKVLRRYLLRRTKEETIGHLMMGKEDNVVFCAMSPLQKRVYKRLLESPDYQSLILKDLPCSCGSKLTRVECCHRTVPDGIIWTYLHRDNLDGCESCPFCLVLPCIIKLQQVSNHLELIKPNPKDDTEKRKKDEALALAVFEKDVDLVGGIDQNESFMGLSDAQHCGKMRALEKLMASWILHGDKILLFSYSVRMLDILEKFLIRKGYCFARLDGSTPMSSRQSLVDGFNQSPSKQVFLISTRAGGIGLNLVSANRVVIFDPNWNPAQDLQAQDRSFRYGQRRHVTVFRLLAAGSLEEIVYTRQIYKQQLFNIVVSGNPEKRYFEGVQDSKEFKGELFGISNLFRDLSDILFTNEIVENHGKRLQSLGNHNQFRHNERATKCLQAVSDKNVTKSRSHECVEEEKSSPITHGKAMTTSAADEHIENTTMKENQSANLPDLANMLTDAGVMYVHRNEDVVNYRKHNPEGTMARECSNLCANNEDVSETRHGSRSQLKDSGLTKVQADSHNCKLKERRKVRGSKKNSRTVAKTMDKNKQYSLLARFKGMGELEFSKWLLSLSSSDMEKLLLDYKRWLLAGKN